jgi:hypothetical protein
MSFWLKHPRTGKPDTMLTLAVLATLTCLAKVLLNNTILKIAGQTITCGTIDGLVIAATLTPTLGAYVARKHKDSPDKKKPEEASGSSNASN